ncbi:MAG: S8 family serine peptidase [Lachnospiraceae bacterium]|nr:S8 family serine peptidase [Lachnospiraceae bacterium]
MKTGKRILALVLAFMMVFSVLMSNLATDVQADDGTQTAAEAESSASEANSEDSKVLKDEMVSEESGDSTRILNDEEAQALLDASAEDSGITVGQDVADADIAAVDETDSGLTVTEVDRDSLDVDLTKSADAEAIESLYADDDTVKVIIEFEGDSVIEGNADVEVGSAYADTKVKMLEKEQASAITAIEEEVLDGEELAIAYQYTWVINAVAAEVTYGDIEAIEALPEVSTVYIQELYSAPETEEETDSDDTLTIGSGEMISKLETWAEGYTGAGLKIAIIDTGLDSDHPSFTALDESVLTEDSATEASIAEVLGSLNAYTRYTAATGKTLTADNVYYSTKIAYGFNYCDDSLDITHDYDEQGDHGTHVAGIAAANETEGTEVVGVAPDAQLYVMKVFGQLGGAYSEDIVAALEDALLLGADVVNMSLGSPAGFSESGYDAVDAVYQNISATSTIVCVSAGNSGTLSESNLAGGDKTENPDNGVVSSPSTYANAISVASVDNAEVMGYYVEADGEKLSYEEGANGYNDSMETLYGQTLEFVMVGGYGEEADYDDIDVVGKIAVVTRGEISFAEKLDYAENAGAVGILVYNNVSGTISADISSAEGTIPFASISMAAGAYLQSVYDAAVEAGTVAELTFSDEMDLVPNDTAYELSYFSSWGTTADLRIEPDITAPGGSIYSTLDSSDGYYGLMSGTSMASPQIAGVSALLQQYLRKNYTLSDSETREVLTALLLSTAVPLAYDDDTLYPVRQQGSGLVNVYNAITSTAYLSVEGAEEPQAELGDDPEKTGEYSFTFDVVNFGDTTLYYDVNTTVASEDYTEDEDGTTFLSGAPINLDAETEADGSAMILTYDYDESNVTDSHDAWTAYQKQLTNDSALTDELFRYDLTGNDGTEAADVQAYLDALVGLNDEVDLTDKIAAVKAGETASVTVSIAVSEDSKAWMDEHFENGIYVEGYTILTALGSGVDLSIPYLAFYGSWTQAPMIDGGFYYQTDEELAETANQYYNVLWSDYAGYENYYELGMNAYVDEDFDASHISLSVNGDGYADIVSDIYVTLLRNAESVTVTFADAEDESNIYNQTVFEKVTKAYYYSSYGVCLPLIYSWYADDTPFDGTDAEGNYLENNDQVLMTIYADLGYGDQSDNVSDTWTETITIDNESPTLDLDEENTYITINEDGTQTLTLTYKDNVDVSAVNFLSKSYIVKAQYAVDHPETKGDYVTATYDITGFGNTFYVVLSDYAFNESAYMFTTTDNLPEVDTSLLYGYRVFDEDYEDATLYGWLSMNTDEEDFASEVVDSEYYMDYAINAAAYVDGYIMAIAADNKFYAITPGLWDEWTFVADLGSTFNTMTYDPANGCLWAYDSSHYALCSIDVLTGEVTQIGSDYSLYGVVALAADDDGTLYAIHSYGYLRTVNTETGVYTNEGDEGYLYYVLNSDVQEISGLTSVSFYNAQSMVYVAEDDCLYWAAFSYSTYWGSYGGLIRIEPDFENNSATLTGLGTIEGNAEVVGLLKIEDRGGVEIPEDEAATAIEIAESSATILVGGSQMLTVNYTPWYATSEGDLVWTSADETIATVSAGGTVTGVSVGETAVTVTTADGSLSDTITVKVIYPDATLYGYALYGYTSLDYQWITFDADDTSDYTELTASGVQGWTAAEYYDGYVYAYNDEGAFYRIDLETYSITKLGALDDNFYGNYVYDMAYDYSTGFLYAIDDYGYLYHVDMLNGQTEYVDYLEDSYGQAALTLAVSTDGTIYFITANSLFCSYDPDAYECTDIGLLGTEVYEYFQSMTYDHNDGGIYWADIYGMYYIDPESGTALYLGSVDGSVTQIVGLYTIIDEIPERDYVAVDYMYTTSDSILLLEGMETSIPVVVYPYNATDRNVTWTVADETVAVVNDGKIVGVSVGETTATGTLGDWEVEITIVVKESTGTLHAYLRYDLSYGGSYQWVTFEDNNLDEVTYLDGAADPETEYQVYAGEYYDGKIYVSGVDMTTYNAMYAILDAETYETLYYLTNATLPTALDMAFDYTTGTMYAIGGQTNSDEVYLYMIDVETGTYYTVAKLGEELYTLACTADGTLYSVDTWGDLFEVDKTTGDTYYVLSTGYDATVYQSMAYDYDTGNIYWAQGSSTYFGGTVLDFLLIDPENYTYAKLGAIGSAGAEAVAMFSIPEAAPEIESTTPLGIAISGGETVIAPGETLQLTATFTPVSVVKYEGEITFSSSDESVATVDENGLVTALEKGSVTITATCGDLIGTYSIMVVDDSVFFYAFDCDGIYTTAVYSPDETTNYTWYDDSSVIGDTEFALAAYSSEDEVFYAVDTDDNLWSFSYDGESFSDETKITGDSSLIDNVLADEDLADILAEDNVTSDEITVYSRDLVMNSFNNKLYLMVEIGYYYEYPYYSYLDTWYFYIYEVDTATGEVSLAANISTYVGTPDSFVFTAEDEIVWYDYYSNTIYRQDFCFVDDESVSSGDFWPVELAWVQNDFWNESGHDDYDGRLSMVYSASMNRIYLAGWCCDYDTWTYTYELVEFDLTTNTISQIGEATYWNCFDLVLFE